MEQILNPLHLACSDDDLRPNMSLIQIQSGIATATNGHILVRIDLKQIDALTPEQLEILDGKFLHKEVWKEIYKCDSVEFDDNGIYCHKNGIKKTFDYSNPNGEFFDTDSVVKDIKDAGEETKPQMLLNPTFITILQKIFQSNQLTFSFSKGNKGVLAYPHYDCGMFAVIMPLFLERVEPRYFFTVPDKGLEKIRKDFHEGLAEHGMKVTKVKGNTVHISV